MAIEIPSEVALFLNICGIPYPDIDEDDVRALAGHVRTFAAQVRDTHESATGVIGQMGAFYSGESYQQLVATWSHMSATHMRRLEGACELVGGALDVAATVITVVKAAVLAELAALAATYASIMVTPPLASSAPLVAAAARRVCEQMSQYLIGYIVAEVVGKAIEPLEQAIDDLVRGIVYDATRDALGVPSSSRPQPLHIDPDAVQHFAKVLDDHADDIMRHAADFAENVSTLDFTTSTLLDDAARHAVADAGPAAPGHTARDYPLGRGEQRAGLPAPAAASGLDGQGTGGAPVPVAPRDAANAVGVRERPVDRHVADRHERESGARVPIRGGDSSALPPSAEGPVADRSASAASAQSRVADSARHPQISAVAPKDAADRLDGLMSPPATSAHAGAPAGTAVGGDAVSEVAQRPASDCEPRRSGSATEPVASAGQEPSADAPVAGVAFSAQQNPGGTATPWGRAAQPPGTPNPVQAKRGRLETISPKVRRPAVTPWSKTRRSREVPAVVHAPSTRPRLRLVGEKGAEAHGAELADANSVRSRVAAPAPEHGDAPPTRG
ncbi:WXG100-like domain-containing protein [Nocardia sp. NPDC004085]